MRRREFLATTAALKATNMQGAGSSLPRRAYKNGIELSVIGLGGIVVCGMPQKDASRRVAEAIDRGVNYFDCAPTYFDGEAELKLGEALRPYRAKIFLAEKTTRRDAQGAREELERTLTRFHQTTSICTSFMESLPSPTSRRFSPPAARPKLSSRPARKARCDSSASPCTTHPPRCV